LGKLLSVYGDGQNIRDWLYVEDRCSVIEAVLQRGRVGETYNVGGNNEVKDIDPVQLLCELMNELATDLPVRPAQSLITFVKDRPGHDRHYAINSTKLKNELGWSPSVTVQEGLRKTVEWFLANEDWWRPLLSEEYQAYYQKVYA